MHVRATLIARSWFTFKFGNRVINYCKTYKYLGLTINQFLDFGKMSNSFGDPANRALSAVVCKMIKNKGFPFVVFETLYNSCVTSITDYSHEVIGYHQYSESANVHTKAIRSYLGVGRSANLCALRYEMAWLEPKSRTQIRMMRFFYRMREMNNNRLTKKIFLYDQHYTSLNNTLTTWSQEIQNIISKQNLSSVIDRFDSKSVLKLLQDSLLLSDKSMLRRECLSSTKLRTYNTLFSPFIPHSSIISYTRLTMSFKQRKKLAQLRLGCLPIRLETERYARPILPAEQRYCLQPECENATQNLPDNEKHVDNEFHFLIKCSQYRSLRKELFDKIKIPNFQIFDDMDKFTYLLTTKHVAHIVSSFIVDAFDSRPVFMS